MTNHQPLQASDGQGQAPATPNRKELAFVVEKVYQEYYLFKAMQKPSSGFTYDTEVTKFIGWLRETAGLPTNKPLQERKMK